MQGNRHNPHEHRGNRPDSHPHSSTRGTAAGASVGLDWPAERLVRLLHATSSAVVGHLETASELPVAPAGPVEPEAIRAWLESRYGFEDPQAGEEVVQDVLNAMRRWSVHTTHPGYFGLFNPTPTGPGIAGELLAAGMNPQLAAWSHAPAAVEIERHVIGFLADRLGLPTESAGSITTGGAEANLTAVLLALMRAFPEYARLGLRGLDAQPVLYASAESHLAWVKIAHIVGLGRDALRLIPVDEQLRIDPASLSAQVEADIAAGLRPFFLAATAGTTGAGAIDPLARLADLAAQRQLWLHTDAAWAGAVALSDRLRPLLAGIERSDSVTVDAHKWLSVPMGAGIVITTHAALLPGVFAASTGFMPQEIDDAPDPYATSIQWSRRFAGLKILLSLAVHTRPGYAAQLERDVDLGHELASRLTADGWQRVNDTPLPVVCVRDPESASCGEDAAWTWHATVAERVVSGGSSWISAVRLAGRPALRAAVTSYRTCGTDLDQLVADLHRARAATPAPTPNPAA